MTVGQLLVLWDSATELSHLVECWEYTFTTAGSWVLENPFHEVTFI